MGKENLFLTKFENRMVKAMLRLNPEWDENEVRKIVKYKMEKEVDTPSVELDNNYTHQHKDDVSLLSVFDWILKDKPIITGNGTFYHNQEEAINPVAQMLQDMLAERKAIKRKMFNSPEGSQEYIDLDRAQKNVKINVNSYYGASGAPSSAFYSQWSGPATTISAQQVISTAEQMYESFLVGNYNFIDMSEFMDWVHVIFKNRPDEIDEFVHTVSPEKLFEKYDNTFINYSNDDRYVLKKFIDNLTSEERIILYYKNNFIQFIDDHPYMKNLYLSVFENVKNYKYYDKDDWKENVSKLKIFDSSELDKMDYKKWKKWVNKEYFMDPNSAPDSIKSILEEFCGLMMKYCYVPYMAFDRIYRLKNFKRRVVTVIDTDSNILALDTLVNYTLNDVLPRFDCYGRDKMHNIFICVNTITYVITEAIKQTLLEYGRLANIPEKYRPSLNMKNELTKKFRKRVISWKNLFNCWKISMRQSAAKIYIMGMWRNNVDA